MPSGHLTIAVLLLLGAMFVVAVLWLSLLLVPRGSREDELARGRGGTLRDLPRVRPRLDYSIHALLSMLFSIGAVFLYPWAVAFGRLSASSLAIMGFFISVLACGLAYAWKEGALTWR